MTIPITGQPPVPSLSEPDTFNTKALNLFTWQTGSMLDQFNNVDPNDFFDIPALTAEVAVVGGTANAITLTTGLGLSSIPEGGAFAFIPSSTNTATGTITIDGYTYNGKTTNGDDWPSGYLRAGERMHCWRIGANVIVASSHVGDMDQFFRGRTRLGGGVYAGGDIYDGNAAHGVHLGVSASEIRDAQVRVKNRGTSSTSYSFVSDVTYDYHMQFLWRGDVAGSITSPNGTSVAYSTTSDYRVKENVIPLIGAAARVQSLNVCRFNFISSPERTVDGFLAHEVQAFVPEAVTGEKDEVDENGAPIMQGIDQSKLVPLLTAALQEALSKIEAMEARLTALEAP